MIRQRFRQCAKCGSEYGRKRGKVIACDRCKPKPEKVKRFADQRQPEFVAWLNHGQMCLVAGRRGRREYPDGRVVSWVHDRCFGRIEAAHVYRTRAQGVPDLGQCVPLCEGAHRASEHNQEHHREEWWSWYNLDRDEEAARYAAQWSSQSLAGEPQTEVGAVSRVPQKGNEK